MEGIVAEICRDLLIRSPKAANSPRCEASKFPEPAPCSLQLLSHCSATLSHSLAAFKNNRLPIARRRCSPRPLLLPLGLRDNTQMIPFATTGTDLFHRPLFFFSGKSISLIFRKQFQKTKQPCCNSGDYKLATASLPSIRETFKL